MGALIFLGLIVAGGVIFAIYSHNKQMEGIRKQRAEKYVCKSCGLVTTREAVLHNMKKCPRCQGVVEI